MHIIAGTTEQFATLSTQLPGCFSLSRKFLLQHILFGGCYIIFFLGHAVVNHGPKKKKRIRFFSHFSLFLGEVFT